MNLKNFLLVLVLAFTLEFNLLFPAQTLDENLKVLQPLLGKTWMGMLKAPDGSKEWKVVRSYQSILDGRAVRVIKSNHDLNSASEGFFYWDAIRKKITFLTVGNKGVVLKGDLTIDRNIITIQGTMTWPKKNHPTVKQSYDFKNTFELAEDSKMIDRWFHNAFGPWRPGHVIEFNSK